MSDSGQRNPIELLADEFVERFRGGETPSLDDYADRYPELAEEIHELFPLLVEMEVARSADAWSVSANRIPLVTPRISQLGDYRIIREIGRGGMGIVYEAEQVSLGRHVALKVLPPNILERPKHRSRFQRESKAAASLHHTNIVPVFGVGEENGIGYYVMQLIDGHGLDDVLRELKQMSLSFTPDTKSPEENDSSVSSIASKLCGSSAFGSHAEPTSDSREPSGSLTVSAAQRRGASGRRKPLTYWDNVARIGNQVAKALDHAHQQGILHRDVKPANLLLDLSGNVWVTDFGLASLESDHQLTETGDVLGTLRYMAPESLKGATDARSEVFSLGLTLYELLVLAPAYDQQNRNKLVDSVLSVRIEPIGKLRPEVPSDLQTIVHKALEPAPDHRYQSAQELAEDLTCFLNDEPIKARRVSLPERFFRWRRQNRGLAALATSLVLIVTLTAVGSTFAAGYLLSLSNRLDTTVVELRTARNTAENRANDNLRLAKEADSARKLSDTTLADMYTQRGLLSSREGDPAAAALWFANAAGLTPHDPVRQSANRMRAKNWLDRSMTPRAHFNLGGHPLKTLEFQPNGYLLMIQRPGDLQIWDCHRDQVLGWTRDLPSVTTACWSPQGHRVAIGHADGMVQIHDVETGDVAFEFEPSGTVHRMVWSPSGTFIATSANSTVQVWRANEQPTLVDEWQHPKRVYGLAFNGAGNRLVTCCQDKQARLFKVGADSTGRSLLWDPVRHSPAWMSKHAQPVFFDADQKIATVSGNRVHWWDVDTGEDVTPALDVERAGFILSLAVSGDGKWIVAGGRFAAMLWNVRGESFRLEHGNNVRNLHFDAQSQSLLSISLNQKAHRWTLPPHVEKPMLFPQLEDFQSGDISADGQLIALGGSEAVTIWGLPGNREMVGQIKQWGGSQWRPRISSDGKLAVPGAIHRVDEPGNSNNNQLNVVTTRDGQRAGPTIELDGNLVDSCFCGDRQRVVAACVQGKQGLVAAYDVTTGESTLEPLAVPAKPLSVTGHPDANEIAVLCRNGHLIVLDIDDGTIKHQTLLAGWRDEGNGFCRVDYTPDGRRLIALTPNHAIEVLDTPSYKRVFPPIRPVVNGGPCRTIDTSADGRWLATGVNGKNVARVWDLSTGEPASPELLHAGQTYGITSVVFSPDGRHLLTGHHDGNARFWDWQTGELLVPPMPHPESVTDVKVTSDGRYAVTGIRLGTVYFWDLNSGKMVAPPVEYPFPFNSVDAIAIADDRLIVSDHGRYALIDLSVVMEEPHESTEFLINAASVSSNQQHQFGELSPFKLDEWKHRFALLKPDWTRQRIETRLADLTAAIEQTPDETSAYHARSNYYQRLGKWDLSAADLLRVKELASHDYHQWAFAANALVLAGKTERYRAHCHDMLKRFRGATGLQAADILTKTCLLLPESVELSELPIEVVRSAASNPQAAYRDFFSACCALYSYRSGDFELAIQWTEDLQDNATDAAKLALVVRAMAEHRMGDVAGARETLSRAERMIPHELRTLSTAVEDAPVLLPSVPRHDDLIAEILRREAVLVLSIEQ